MTSVSATATSTATAPVVATFGGFAGTAVYFIEIRQQGDMLTVISTSGKYGGTLRPKETPEYHGSDREAAYTALIKLANNKRRGRERAYTQTVPGVQADNLPNGVLALTDDGNLPVHAQIWCVGRPTATLPQQLARYAQVGDSQTSATPTVEIMSPSTPATGPITPSVPIMLCVDAEDSGDPTLPDDLRLREKAQPYIVSDDFCLMRKMEGDRWTLMKNADGIRLFNRLGQPIPCPVALQQVAQALPDGTILDGEGCSLTTIDPLGTESLYAGAAADKPCFVVFDLIAHPDMPAGANTLQTERLTRLAQVVAALGQQSQIRLVPIARTSVEKQLMIECGLQHRWEGWVARDLDSRYGDERSRRSGYWVRLKCYRVIDAVVVGANFGSGTNAQRVSTLNLALYDDTGTLVPIGKVGNLTVAERERWTARRSAGTFGQVVQVQIEGPTADLQVLRPVYLGERPSGDKPATACRLATEFQTAIPPQVAG